MYRRISALVVLLLVLVSVNTTVFAYETSSSPRIVIGRKMDTPVFNAGEEVRLAIPLDNDSTMKARHIIMYPVIEDPNEFPFEIDKATIKRSVGSISGQSSEKVPFYFKVKENAQDKVYTINFKVDYETENGSSNSDSQNLYIRITNDKVQPNIKIADVKLPGKEIPSGKVSRIELDLNNKSDLDIKDLEVKITGFDNKITLSDYVDTQRVESIKAKEYAKVKYNIKVDSEVESGTYSLTLEMKYKDKYDKEYEQKQNIYLPVSGEDDQELNLALENISSPKEVSPNEDFSLSFNLKNNSPYDAKSVKVTVDAGESILPKSSSIKSVGTLGAGKGQSLEFVLFPKDGAESKNYPVKVSVEYKISGEKTQTFEQYVGIFVDDKGVSQNPKIIIDNYNYGNDFIKAGEEFNLDLSFFNTNSAKTVKNIKVTLKPEGGIFSPVGSSNSFFIENIGSKSRASKTMKLKTKPDAKYQDYNIVVSMEYEDGSGSKYTAEETIGVPVIQDSRLVVSDVELPDEVFANTPTNISVDFYNMGRSQIRNLIINTKGDFRIKNGTLYVGNLEAGSDNYYDATIIPEKEGGAKGAVTFEFDDEVGNHQIIEKEISINAQKEPEIEMPEMPEPEEKDSSKMKWIVGLVILGVGGFLFYKKRKKKTEEVGIDE
ncbi:COG1361 S-layer family protein [Anaeromicrobium sediminis]|uniref:CARDB domain-containing protein n=1 Tax=Anaeromicrobium sediminis TaxID=1478221 RepID=A0A267MCE0_9FIRM|nr:COG1361 S-layer family protein [Anaeromicrobium sediminis]PAB57254.1 hypothetical protein CCE28_19415 [Anaeromicrobium sediminis]